MGNMNNVVSSSLFPKFSSAFVMLFGAANFPKFYSYFMSAG